jgi:hypothetical protein
MSAETDRRLSTLAETRRLITSVSIELRRALTSPIRELERDWAFLQKTLHRLQTPTALEAVPIEWVQDLKRTLELLETYFSDVRKPSIDVGQAIDDFRPLYSELLARAWLPSLEVHPALQNLAEAEDNFRRQEADLRRAAADVEALREKSTDLATQLSTHLAKLAESAFQKEFSAIKKTSGEAAKRWLVAVGCISVVLLAVGTASFLAPQWGLSDHPSTAEVATHIAARLVVISTLFYALGLATRNYRSAKHNELVVKRHQELTPLRL